MMIVRSAVFNVWFVGMTVLYGSAGLPVRWFARHRALGLAQGWARAVLWGAEHIAGIRTVVTGRENLPGGAALIASEHQSAFDTIIWLHLVPRVSYVFKYELGQIPLFGPLLVPAGQIPIDRGASFAAVRSLLRGVDKAKADGRQIVIFPEGTRVEPGSVTELRPGLAVMAARTRLPVIPVATDSGRLWGRRAFRKHSGIVHIVIGPAIPPDLPQAALLAAVRERWDAAHAGLDSVDNLVDGA